MSDDRKGRARPRRYRWRYGPLRLIMPWLGFAAGIIMVVRGAVVVGANGDPLLLILGASLMALSATFFFVYRWMARRGI